MKKGLLVLFLVTIFSVSSLFANGLSLNSVGPRALGMGGAMVGLADDPTAIYWNPAGLAGQNSSLYAFGTDIIPFGTYKANSSDFGYPPDYFVIDAKTKTNHYASPNLFANYSMGKLAFGLGVFVPAGLGAEYNGADLIPISAGDLEWMSKIGVIDIAPTIAYKINDMFSFGVTGNIFYGMFDMKRPSIYTDTLGVSHGFQYSESSTGTGFGVSGGLLCKLSEMIQFGVSARTEIKVTMSGEAENALMSFMGYLGTSDFDRDVAWPLWAAFGVAVKPMENLTITADAQYSQWAKSEKEFHTDFKDPYWKAATATTGDDTFVLDWKDCTQLRFGLEYMASEKLALRAGFYYDPAPAPDSTLTILFPSSTNNAVTAGLGFCAGKFDIDFGLEYIMGKERDVAKYPTVGAPENMPGKHKLDIFAFSLAIGMGLM